jgi:hypothetical protein
MRAKRGETESAIRLACSISGEFTYKEIAELTGVKRNSTSAQISKYKRDGLVALTSPGCYKWTGPVEEFQPVEEPKEPTHLTTFDSALKWMCEYVLKWDKYCPYKKMEEHNE